MELCCCCCFILVRANAPWIVNKCRGKMLEWAFVVPKQNACVSGKKIEDTLRNGSRTH